MERRTHSSFPARSRRLPRLLLDGVPQRRRWMRQCVREVNEINGIAFAGMPGSFPGRNEGEPFHVCCGLNLPPPPLAPEPPPGAARSLARSFTPLLEHAGRCINENDRLLLPAAGRHLRDEQRRINLLSDPSTWIIQFTYKIISFVYTFLSPS